MNQTILYKNEDEYSIAERPTLPANTNKDKTNQEKIQTYVEPLQRTTHLKQLPNPL